MSVSVVLVPLAITYGISLGSAAIAALCATRTKPGQRDLEPVDTMFSDSALLVKTLTQHGLQLKQLGEDEFLITTEAGMLRYFRTAPNQPFQVEAKGISNLEDMLSSLNELETEYNRNVQAFTYQKIMDGLLEHGLTLDNEEVLEDDTILLTLNI